MLPVHIAAAERRLNEAHLLAAGLRKERAAIQAEYSSFVIAGDHQMIAIHANRLDEISRELDRLGV